MKHHKFNNDFMNTLFDKITKENKPSIISGDFNLNLIKYTQNRGVNQFLENVLSNNFIPHITLPTRVTKKSATLIDRIFTNNCKRNWVNLNLIKYTQNGGVNQFLENILSNNFIPHMALPTRVTEKSATLIDSIFTSNYEPNWVSGNITTYISDHFPHFLIIEELKQIPTISFRDYKNFSDDFLKQNLVNLIGH